MAVSIQFRTNDPTVMEALSEQIQEDLAAVGLAESLDLSEPSLEAATGVTRSADPTTWATIIMTAVGTGGALSVLLSKDGVLAALAAVLEKYVEGRKVDIVIDKGNGEKVQVSGPASEIQGVLKQLR